MAPLRIRHLGHHFMKPGDFESISVSRTLQFVQAVGLLNATSKGLHTRLVIDKVHRSLQSLPSYILFYSNCEQKVRKGV
jgi:hypothetical protein